MLEKNSASRYDIFRFPSFMMNCSAQTKVRKQHIAFALALLAVCSYLYGVRMDQHVAGDTDIAGITAALASNSSGNYEMFLKLDTIQGDADDQKHRNEIVVDSFSFTQARPLTASRPTMDGFRVTLPISRASAKLFLFGASGTKIPRATLAVRKTGSAQDFLKWTLTDVQVLSYQTVGNTHGDGIVDQATFSFAKLEFEYRQLLPDGTLGAMVQSGWDQRSNKSVQ